MLDEFLKFVLIEKKRGVSMYLLRGQKEQLEFYSLYNNNLKAPCGRFKCNALSFSSMFGILLFELMADRKAFFRVNKILRN